MVSIFARWKFDSQKMKKVKNMIEKREVTGVEALEYLQNQLSLGGKTLSNYINQHPLQYGQVYSFVPKGTSQGSLYNFKSGGIYFSNKESLSNGPILIPIRNDAKDILINIINEFIQNTDDNCCIFEEPNAKPSDPWISNSGIEYIFYGEEIFYFFDKSNNNKEGIENAIKRSDGYYFLCALGSLNFANHAGFTSFQSVSPELLKAFVQKIAFFFVKAYDGEGYLMWTNK